MPIKTLEIFKILFEACLESPDKPESPCVTLDVFDLSNKSSSRPTGLGGRR